MSQVRQMQDNGILSVINDGKIIINRSGERLIAFFCSLLRSQIECYWASLVYITTIARTSEYKH